MSNSTLSAEDMHVYKLIVQSVGSDYLKTGEEISKLISEIRSVYLSPDSETVSKQNLEWLTNQVKEYNQFKTDAETDIGYLAQSVYNLQNMGDPTKLIGKLLMGKLDLGALGLDIDRMAAIGQKYAPVKFAELKSKEEQSKKKK